MPVNRYYTVTQQREVKITAISAVDAVLLANAEFEGEHIGNPQGRVLSPVRVRDIQAREDS